MNVGWTIISTLAVLSLCYFSSEISKVPRRIKHSVLNERKEIKIHFKGVKGAFENVT